MLARNGKYRYYNVTVRFTPSLTIRLPSTGSEETSDVQNCFIGFEDMEDCQFRVWGNQTNKRWSFMADDTALMMVTLFFFRRS